ncbi:hypothetical protein [Streptomyces sp. NPDC051286]|uniref:hypothetical protein n=1 Tax=Streptomyces sp. NPDC051286 TaxID=3365647 RepID=UPI0037A2D196
MPQLPQGQRPQAYGSRGGQCEVGFLSSRPELGHPAGEYERIVLAQAVSEAAQGLALHFGAQLVEAVQDG